MTTLLIALLAFAIGWVAGCVFASGDNGD